MKVGIRKPDPMKSIKARTTGRAKRAVKSSIDPTYGKKGAGWVKDPKKDAYNAVYRRTSISAMDAAKMAAGENPSNRAGGDTLGEIMVGIVVFIVLLPILLMLVTCSH